MNEKTDEIKEVKPKARFFGLGVKTFLAVVLFATVAFAVTVAYLSNTVTMTTNVDSPLVFTILSGMSGVTAGVVTGGTSIDFGTTYAVDPIVMTTELHNQANNNVYGNIQMVCGDGAGTMDCTQMSMSDTYGAYTCVDNAGTAVYTSADYTFVSGITPDTITATLTPAFYGALSCTGQVIPS